jgi:hypothetical protein
MKTKNKPTKPAKPARPEADKAEPEYSFSFEFLDALLDTAEYTLLTHLRKMKVPHDVEQLLDMILCIHLEQERMLEGRTQDLPDMVDKVLRTVHSIAALGGEWYGPTGSITPLQERLAMGGRERAEEAKKKSSSAA